MGYYINQVTILGKAGRDAEIKDAGTSKVARFSVATSEGGYKKTDGTDVPRVTHWHNIQCWNKLAELAGKIVTKGATIAINGKITYREYETRDGQKKSVTEIIANDIILCSGGEEKSEQNANKVATDANYIPAESLTKDNVPPIDDDDLPF